MVTKVLITSTNPVKTLATRKAFSHFFSNIIFHEVDLKIEGSNPQPIGEDETYNFSRRRVENGRNFQSGFNFYVGIEGGVVINPQKYPRIVVYSSIGNERFIETIRGCEIPLPQQWYEDLVEQRYEELGDLVSEISGISNIKQKEGAIGFLSRNVVKRYDILKQSIIMALIPFLNPSLFDI